jgi:hypothetical protein
MPVFAFGYDVAVFAFGFVLANQNWLAKTKFAASWRTKTGGGGN